MAFVKLCLEAMFANTCAGSSILRRSSVAFVLVHALQRQRCHQATAQSSATHTLVQKLSFIK